MPRSMRGTAVDDVAPSRRMGPRKIEINAEVSSANGVRLREVIEVDADATDDEIRAEVDEIVFQWVSWGWSDAADDAEVTQ